MLDFIEKKSISGENKYLIIFLHGYGSDKYDLMSLSDEFNSISSDIYYISVNAPFICDNGYGYQWFELKEITLPYVMNEVKKNYKIIENFVKLQSDRLNINYENIFLVGFSQGAIISLYASIRLDKKLAGIIAFSGFMAETIDELKNNLKNKQKIIMIHGVSDQIIPYIYFEYSKNILQTMNFENETYSINHLDHSINYECINYAKSFVKKIIKKNK